MSLELLEEMEGDGKSKKNGPSLIVFIVVCAVITLAAGGAGFGVSATMLKPADMTAAPVGEHVAEETAADSHGAPESGHGAEAGHAAPAEHAKTSGLPSDPGILDLEPLTTNLRDPADTWIRMELSLVFDGKPDHGVAEEIHQDILAYVRTMKLYNLRGGSGYQHLMEDLDERAAIRSDGRVKRVLVRSFILE